MIYEPELGESRDTAIVNAVKQGCNKVVLHERIYEIRLVPVGTFVVINQDDKQQPSG